MCRRPSAGLQLPGGAGERYPCSQYTAGFATDVAGLAAAAAGRTDGGGAQREGAQQPGATPREERSDEASGRRGPDRRRRSAMEFLVGRSSWLLVNTIHI